MTTLEAVNLILEAAQESPVEDLSGVSATSIEGRAQSMLAVVSRKVQAEGFIFNTDYGITIEPTSDEILLPNVLSMEVEQVIPGRPAYTIRDGKLYDPESQSYTFTSGVKFKRVVRFVDFEDLPYTAQNYIAERAATRFVEKILGVRALRDYSRESEYQAQTAFMNDPVAQERLDFLSGPQDSEGRFRY